MWPSYIHNPYTWKDCLNIEAGPWMLVLWLSLDTDTDANVCWVWNCRIVGDIMRELLDNNFTMFVCFMCWFQYETISLAIEIPIVNRDHLIFIMGIPMLLSEHPLLKQPPGYYVIFSYS